MSQAITAAKPPEKPEKPKTTWERVVTSTPVVLTVVATILAGLSSSEMTRAMYYRAMAAQHQAKVSDQWNFFQAKRIRGTSMDLTISMLRSASGAGRVSMDSLQATASRLPGDYQRGEEQADALLKAVAAAHGELGPAADPLRGGRALPHRRQDGTRLGRETRRGAGRQQDEASPRLPHRRHSAGGPRLDPRKAREATGSAGQHRSKGARLTQLRGPGAVDEPASPQPRHSAGPGGDQRPQDRGEDEAPRWPASPRRRSPASSMPARTRPPRSNTSASRRRRSTGAWTT